MTTTVAIESDLVSQITTVTHVVASLGENAGGPSRTVPGLVESTPSRDVNIQILTACDPAFGENRELLHLEIRTLSSGSGFADFRDALQATCSARSIIHDHGQWLACNRAAASVARKRKVPRISTPRGMLSPWAMQFRKWKKRVAWYAFARRDIRSADVLHATSQLEASELRDLGLRQPIAVIPNGVDEIDLSAPLQLPPGVAPRFVLFMSRVHEKKGVPEMLRAWKRLDTDGWQLVIAGPDESNILGPLLPAAGSNVVYLGAVEGVEKDSLLRAASLFVLPSYSENFGVVVAEAMIAETPVITTVATPWEILNTHDAGWCGAVGEKAFEEILADALTTDPDVLAAKGRRGRKIVEENFMWPAIGARMVTVYRWMLGNAERPPCIQTRN